MASAVGEVIENAIRATASEHKLNLPPLKKNTALVEELGFTSWTLIALLTDLETALGVDPLYDEAVMITDIRTFGDLCDLYENCLARVE